MRRVTTIFLFFLFLTSCVSGINRQIASAGAIGCPSDEVEVTSENGSAGFRTSTGSWTATCRGRSFVCSETQVGGTREVSSQVTTCAARPAGVERVRSSDGHSWRLRATLPSPPLTLTLVETPESDPTRVGVLINVPADTAYDCRTGAVVDGAVVPWALTREQRPMAPYAGMIDIAQVRTWATATRVAARVCDLEWRLTPEIKAVIADFLGRFDDAAAWQSGGSRPPPP